MQIINSVATDASRRRQDRIARCIAGIAAAEEQARERDLREKRKPRHYLVNYRVGIRDSVTKGTGKERRDALVQILRSLQPLETHESTSSWTISLHLDAETITTLINPVFDERFDGLHVSQVSSSNRRNWGATGLRN